jgi:hypothetical protein
MSTAGRAGDTRCGSTWSSCALLPEGAMARKRPDLFGEAQPDLFREKPAQAGSPIGPTSTTCARRRGRAPKTTGLYRTVFPQMANWLPEDEANQLRFEFARELERPLKAA